MKHRFLFPNVIYLGRQPYVLLGMLSIRGSLITTDDEFYFIVILSLISGKA